MCDRCRRTRMSALADRASVLRGLGIVGRAGLGLLWRIPRSHAVTLEERIHGYWMSNIISLEVIIFFVLGASNTVLH